MNSDLGSGGKPPCTLDTSAEWWGYFSFGDCLAWSHEKFIQKEGLNHLHLLYSNVYFVH